MCCFFCGRRDYGQLSSYSDSTSSPTQPIRDNGLLSGNDSAAANGAVSNPLSQQSLVNQVLTPFVGDVTEYDMIGRRRIFAAALLLVSVIAALTLWGSFRLSKTLFYLELAAPLVCGLGYKAYNENKKAKFRCIENNLFLQNFARSPENLQNLTAHVEETKKGGVVNFKGKEYLKIKLSERQSEQLLDLAETLKCEPGKPNKHAFARLYYDDRSFSKLPFIREIFVDNAARALDDAARALDENLSEYNEFAESFVEIAKKFKKNRTIYIPLGPNRDVCQQNDISFIPTHLKENFENLELKRSEELIRKRARTILHLYKDHCMRKASSDSEFQQYWRNQAKKAEYARLILFKTRNPLDPETLKKFLPNLTENIKKPQDLQEPTFLHGLLELAKAKASENQETDDDFWGQAEEILKEEYDQHS